MSECDKMALYVDYKKFVAEMKVYEKASCSVGSLQNSGPGVVKARVLGMFPTDLYEVDEYWNQFASGQGDDDDDLSGLTVTLMDSLGTEVNAVAKGSFARQLEGHLMIGEVYEFFLYCFSVRARRNTHFGNKFELAFWNEILPTHLKQEPDFPQEKLESLSFDYGDVESAPIQDIIGVVVYIHESRNDWDNMYVLIANPYGDIAKVTLAHSYQMRHFATCERYRTVVAIRGVKKAPRRFELRSAHPTRGSFLVFDDSIFRLNPDCPQYIELTHWMDGLDEPSSCKQENLPAMNH